MAKRKRGQPQAKTTGRGEDFDPTASKLTVNSYRDVGDSEDEFLAHRDKILLQDTPDAKRRKDFQDVAIEASDEEVLGFDEDDEEIEYSDDGEEGDVADATGELDGASEGSEELSEEDEDGAGTWGSRKADYYNADAIETEQDALDEEAEARRIQQKQRKALREADFGFDEDAWVAAGDKGEDSKGGIVTEVLPQLQITDDMSDAEKVKLLKARYPEFEPLSKEFIRLQPVYEELKEDSTSQREEAKHVYHVVPLDTLKSEWKYRVLSGYLGALAMYFALLTSTATNDPTKSLPMPAADLREHEVISSLEQYQRLWTLVEPMNHKIDDGEREDLYPDVPSARGNELLLPIDDYDFGMTDDEEEEQLKGSEKNAVIAAKTASDARRAARLQKTEERLKSLDNLDASKAGRRAQQEPKSLPNDADSDIGDEQPLLADEAAEKVRKRKSLRFYTSQIAQKANKRANAGRAAGGDDDIPHRERLRDRQERLNREALKRGVSQQNGVDLDGDVGGVEVAGDMTNIEREELRLSANGEAMEARMIAKKKGKNMREEAYLQAKEEGGRVVMREMDKIGPDGRREIGYVIDKNKGLIPKRKKEAKNPRVKKRKKYEEKTKKLRSMRPTYKGGEGRGGYGGELTGIKRNLVRSTKL